MINPPPLSERQQQWLDAARQACSRMDEENGRAYSRRLKKHNPHLENAALAKGSGLPIATIESDPMINPPTLSEQQQRRLDAAVQARPRRDADKWDSTYALRFKEYDPGLEDAALAKGSGATIAAIRQLVRGMSPVESEFHPEV